MTHNTQTDAMLDALALLRAKVGEEYVITLKAIRDHYPTADDMAGLVSAVVGTSQALINLATNQIGISKNDLLNVIRDGIIARAANQ